MPFFFFFFSQIEHRPGNSAGERDLRLPDPDASRGMNRGWKMEEAVRGVVDGGARGVGGGGPEAGEITAWGEPPRCVNAARNEP